MGCVCNTDGATAVGCGIAGNAVIIFTVAECIRGIGATRSVICGAIIVIAGSAGRRAAFAGNALSIAITAAFVFFTGGHPVGLAIVGSGAADDGFIAVEEGIGADRACGSRCIADVLFECAIGNAGIGKDVAVGVVESAVERGHGAVAAAEGNDVAYAAFSECLCIAAVAFVVEHFDAQLALVIAFVAAIFAVFELIGINIVRDLGADVVHLDVGAVVAVERAFRNDLAFVGGRARNCAFDRIFAAGQTCVLVGIAVNAVLSGPGACPAVAFDENVAVAIRFVGFAAFLAFFRIENDAFAIGAGCRAVRADFGDIEIAIIALDAGFGDRNLVAVIFVDTAAGAEVGFAGAGFVAVGFTADYGANHAVFGTIAIIFNDAPADPGKIHAGVEGIASALAFIFATIAGAAFEAGRCGTDEQAVGLDRTIFGFCIVCAFIAFATGVGSGIAGYAVIILAVAEGVGIAFFFCVAVGTIFVGAVIEIALI